MGPSLKAFRQDNPQNPTFAFMKFEVGDKVVIKHSNDDGEVIEIIDDKNGPGRRSGRKIPCIHRSVDFPYFKRFTEKKLFPEKKQKQYVDQVRPEKPVSGPKEGADRAVGGGCLADFPACLRQ